MLTELHYTTADADEACAFVENTFAGAGLRISGRRGADWTASVDVADAGSFSSSRMRLPAQVDYDVGYDDQVFVTTVLGGRVRAERGRRTTSYSPGDVLLGGSQNAAQEPWRVQTEEVELAVVTLPAATMGEVLGSAPGEPCTWDPAVFEPAPAGLRRWRRLTRYVDELLADPDVAASTLVLGAASRLLAATAVEIFPTEPPPEPGGAERDAHPETLRRAIAFVEANPDLDIGLADVARAARVTPRAVQLAFRRHVGVTPMAYLRRVRLDRVRADLMTADPGTTTVTAVAARWGFASSSRFSSHYRAAYGEPPHETLRR